MEVAVIGFGVEGLGITDRSAEKRPCTIPMPFFMIVLYLYLSHKKIISFDYSASPELFVVEARDLFSGPYVWEFSWHSECVECCIRHWSIMIVFKLMSC